MGKRRGAPRKSVAIVLLVHIEALVASVTVAPLQFSFGSRLAQRCFRVSRLGDCNVYPVRPHGVSASTSKARRCEAFPHYKCAETDLWVYGVDCNAMLYLRWAENPVDTDAERENHFFVLKPSLNLMGRDLLKRRDAAYGTQVSRVDRGHRVLRPRMTAPVESSFQGYISSTHDALLIFECVRRGILPVVNRRLREDERKSIRSGQVFVFDEKQSGIKRWTDGFLWSPSRILFNFLVYRQVESKSAASKNPQAEALPSIDKTSSLSHSASQTSFTNESGTIDFGAMMYGDPNSASASTSSPAQHMQTTGMPYNSPSFGRPFDVNDPDHGHFQAATWESLSMLDGFQSGAQIPNDQAQTELNAERHLVGSLTSSYPFAKGGLCKKTISIQIENSTQHLISYYTVEDVRSGRLRTPSSLPELASMAISPIFLTKTAFRFPPTVSFGPDGVPRFAGEEGLELGQRKGDQEISSGEGTSSGSESRPNRSFDGRAHQNSQLGHARRGSRGAGNLTLRTRALTSVNVPTRSMTSSTSQPLIRGPPLPHQIGGSGNMPAMRRSSDDALRATSVSHNQVPGFSIQPSSSATNLGSYQNMTTNVIAPARSPTSMPSTPFAPQVPMDPSMFVAFAQGVASPALSTSRQNYEEVRPHTASSTFTRPLSDQGPIFHSSAQENLRRAIATSGWEPTAPSTYHGSSNTLNSSNTALLSRHDAPFQQHYISEQALSQGFDFVSRSNEASTAHPTSNIEQNWVHMPPPPPLDNNHLLVHMDMQQRDAQPSTNPNPPQWHPHYDPSIQQSDLPHRTDEDAFAQFSALSQSAAQPISPSADMYQHHRLLPSGLPGHPQQ